MTSQLVEAWRMSNEANLYLLEEIATECLKDTYSPRTRTVAAQFVHMHNVRLRWLAYSAPELEKGPKAFPKGAQPTRAQLKTALRASEKIVAVFLKQCESTGKVKGWNGSPATFLSYLVAHEAHHRGLAMVAMRISRRKLAQETVYGQWQWGKKRDTRKKGSQGRT
jgi:uncharacterized damage-inducible protein DinB